MKNTLSLLAVASLLAGCATYKPTIPEGYIGPRATVKDTVKQYSNSKADFFYVSHVDGNEVENSRIRTLIANSGRGPFMTPVVLQHEIPARSVALSIIGRTQYAAPILAIIDSVYEVKGVVEFVAEPNKTYAVRGKLGGDGSAVWVEEESTSSPVGKKIQSKGSAKLGLFDK